MKGFLQEYGIIMVVVAVVLGMLAFGKTGYAKSIQNAILGSADHIVETGENITNKETGDILEIEGNKYIVIEQRGSGKSLVMAVSTIGSNTPFQSTKRSDGLPINTYEESEIDNYLENEWYNGLSSTMKAAIQTTNIKQTSYKDSKDPDSKQETGYNGQVYNTISRHVFLPSVNEIGKVVDLKNPNKVKVFLNYFDKNVGVRTRDGCYLYTVMTLGYSYSSSSGFYYGLQSNCFTEYSGSMHPAFVIDLSKVDYTEVGHVDYK